MSTHPETSPFAELVDQLDAIRHDDTLVGDKYVAALTGALLSTPYLAPIDDYTVEMLLEFSGLCLNDAVDIAFGAAITQLLIGTGHFEIVCTHDDPSPLCARVRSGIDEEVREHGADLARSGSLDEVLEVRRRRSSGPPAH